MSYILDALKKAEAERQAGAPPSIHAPLPVATPAAQVLAGRARSAWWLAVAGVAVAGAAAWWLLPREQPVRLTPPVPTAAPLAAARPAVTELPATEEVPASAPPLKAERKTPEKPAAPEAPRKAVRAEKMENAERAEKAAKAEKAEQPAPRNDDRALPGLRELPEQVRAQVPAMTIGGYLYSTNKADRSVLVNNRLLREGDEIAPGLRVERMEPNWMVLDFRGTRFRHSY